MLRVRTSTCGPRVNRRPTPARLDSPATTYFSVTVVPRAVTDSPVEPEKSRAAREASPCAQVSLAQPLPKLPSGSVVMARKGGVSPDRVAKTLDLPNFQNYLAAHRTRLLAKALKSAGVSAARSGDELAEQMSPFSLRPPAIAKGPPQSTCCGGFVSSLAFRVGWGSAAGTTSLQSKVNCPLFIPSQFP